MRFLVLILSFSILGFIHGDQVEVYTIPSVKWRTTTRTVSVKDANGIIQNFTVSVEGFELLTSEGPTFFLECGQEVSVLYRTDVYTTEADSLKFDSLQDCIRLNQLVTPKDGLSATSIMTLEEKVILQIVRKRIRFQVAGAEVN